MVIKTAVSFDEKLLERIDRAAQELRLPRSRLLARAAEEFLTEHENRALLERLNRAYCDRPTAEESELRRRQRGRHRRAVEGSW
jgi:metal-responsive CopG/Arc/MetJ family transcriptional regulator